MTIAAAQSSSDPADPIRSAPHGAGSPAGPDAVPGTTATPNDYLEKIFQIPFWLRTPGEDGVRRMLLGLMQEELGGTTASVSGNAGGGPIILPVEPTSDVVFKRRRHDPAARSLDIQPQEREYIERLAPLLDRSPRAVKRFVNVYRLLKASLPPEEQDSFLDEGGSLGAPYKAVLLLLAVENGLPACSDALLPALLVAQSSAPVPGTPAANLGTLIASVQAGCPARKEEADHLAAWLDRELPGAWKATNPADLGTWVSRVARYSYHLHRGDAR